MTRPVEPPADRTADPSASPFFPPSLVPGEGAPLIEWPATLLPSSSGDGVAQSDTPSRGGTGPRDAVPCPTGRRDLVDAIDGIVWEAVPEPLHFTFVSRQSERILGYPAGAWTADPGFWLAHVHPEDREWVPAYCRRATAAKRSHAFEYRMIASDERVVWIRDAVTVILRDGKPVLLQGILTDVTAARAAREELRRRNQELETLHRLAAIPRASASLQETCDAFAAAIADTMGFPLAVIERLDVSRGRMVPRSACGLAIQDLASEDGVPLADSLSGLAVRTRKAVVLDRGKHRREVARDPIARRGVRTLIHLPLEVGGRVIGTLGLGHPEATPLDEPRMRWLESVASHVASAIDRKESEEALRGAYLALDRTADAAFLVDEHARFLYANDAACRSVGYTRKELLASDVSRIYPPFTPEFWRDHWRQCREEGSFTLEAVHARKDGTCFPVEVSVNYFEVGTRGYVCGIARDITKRRRHEQALRWIAQGTSFARGEDFFRSMVRHLTAVLRVRSAFVGECQREPSTAVQTLAVWDGDGFAENLRYDPMGSPCCEVAGGETSFVSDDLAAAFPAFEPGRRFGARGFLGAPLMDSLGNVLGVLAILDDSPLGEDLRASPIVKIFAARAGAELERKRAERDLRLSNRRLETAITKLAETQEQVLQQERLRALGQMASGIAHDLNNALMPVLGFSELLLQQPNRLHDAARVTRYLRMMHTSASDACEVLRRVREFYRRRTNEETFQQVDLNRLVEQTVLLTRPRWNDQARAGGVHIDVVTELGNLAAIAGNETELREVLTNLLFNAVDAMPDGGRIRIRSALADGEPRESDTVEPAERFAGPHVVLHIEDTGIGMDAETARRCLEPFFTTKREHGTGLGLSVAYGILKRHEGTIRIDSALGAGTTVTLRFPLLVDPAPVLPGALPGEVPSVRPLDVLAVEDEPLVREVLQEYLSADGHRITWATNGREGLERFRPGAFDVVITDKAMPEMNGTRLAVEVKRIDPSQPLILLTGFGELMIAQGDVPPEVDAILSKPITINQLRRALAEVLEPALRPI